MKYILHNDMDVEQSATVAAPNLFYKTETVTKRVQFLLSLYYRQAFICQVYHELNLHAN